MLIERDENINNSSFENLVIQEDFYNNQKAAIIKYNPTEISNSIDNSFRFTGSIEKTNIVNFIGLNRNEYTNTTHSDPDCYIELTVCNNGINGGIGTEHIAGAGCKRTYIKRYKVLCGGGSGDGNGGGGDGDTGGNDYGSDDDFWSGGGDGSANDFDNSGGGSDGDSSTNPTPEEEEPELITSPIPNLDAPKSTPCQHLNKMLTNSTTKERLRGLRDFTAEDYEKGFSVFKSNNTLNTIPCNASNFNPNQVKMPTGKTAISENPIVGAFHTHPNPSTTNITPMFSDGDINWLFWVATDNPTPRNEKIYEEFFLTLTVSGGTYAIKIKDWTKFAAFRSNKAWQNIEGTKGGELKTLKDKYDRISANGNRNSMINAFLETLQEFDAGIGLYEANSDLSNWSELVLAPGASSYNEIDPNEIPCQ